MRCALLSTLMLATAGLVGCGESSDDSPDASTSSDAGPTPDGTVTSADGAQADASSGDPLANLPGDQLFRYAHMHAAGTNMPAFPERVDVCLTRQGGGGTAMRMYEGTSGIGRFEVGAWRVLTSGRYDAKVIAAADTCAGTAVYTTQVDQLATSMYRRLSFVQITTLAGQTANLYADTLLPASFTGQDVITFLNTIVSAPAQELRFMDGAGTVTARNNFDLQLAPGRSGTLTMSFAGPNPPANVSRPYRSARGRLMAFGHGNGDDQTVGLTVCDDLAPPDGHLSHCGSAVRAP
ncbi:MAG: hypothetical protein IT370_15710 [Deltaproteobacteria bacterium]|nr:hypothetical protein [Deltaproteobacteria bacterium]